MTPLAKTARVALLDFEMSERQLVDWLADQGIRNDDRVLAISMRGRASSFDILDEEVREQWAEHLQGVGYLILDPLRPILDALGLDEHHDAGRLLTAFDALCSQAKIPDALIVHHMGHSSERPRGDSRIRDWPDVEWQLVREDKDNPASARYIKAYGRDVEIVESLLTFNADTRRLTLAGGTRKDTKARAAIPDIIAVLESVENGLSIRRITEELSESAHSRETIRQALRLSEGDGTLEVAKGPRNARVYRLSVPVRGSERDLPPRDAVSAPVPIGTGALHTHSIEGVSAAEQPELPADEIEP